MAEETSEGEAMSETKTYDAHKAARTTDPETSHEAARSMLGVAEGQQAELLAAVKRLGETTTEDAGDDAGLTYHQASRRMPELVRLGVVEPTGETRKNRSGRRARVFRAVR